MNEKLICCVKIILIVQCFFQDKKEPECRSGRFSVEKKHCYTMLVV